MLGTGQIKLYYPTDWPSLNDGTSPIGGLIGSTLVNGTNTGLFPTGQSALAGGATYTRYAKVFFKHEGDAADTLSNPLIYITNITNSNQISICPDAFWFIAGYTSQTGGTANRSRVPSGLSDSYFTGYTVENPLSFTAISTTGSVSLSTGQYIGVWVRQRIVGGLGNSYDNSFNLAIKGEVG